MGSASRQVDKPIRCTMTTTHRDIETYMRSDEYHPPAFMRSFHASHVPWYIHFNTTCAYPEMMHETQLHHPATNLDIIYPFVSLALCCRNLYETSSVEMHKGCDAHLSILRWGYR